MKEIPKLKSEIEQMKKEETERFLIEMAVIYQTPEWSNENIPTCFKVLFLSMIHWQVFDSLKNKTFCTNLLNALNYVIQVISIFGNILNLVIEILQRCTFDILLDKCWIQIN